MTAHYHDLAKAAESVEPLDYASVRRLLRPGVRPFRPYRDMLKRCLDVVLVLIALPVVLPLVAVLAMVVALDGGKPFYAQLRLGRHGRTYTMYKLRTMVLNADSKLEAHLAADPEARAEWNSTQKLKNDPRITVSGRFLRKSSFDELPQLWNVLIGDMSLVGPRPMLPEQERLYPGTAYFDMRPGVTGTWQISDRNSTTFADRARFDTGYGASLSFPTDVRIIAATFRVVLRGTGY